jgi:PEGA domain
LHTLAGATITFPVVPALLAILLAAPEPPRVALLPLRPLGVPADVVRALEVTLRNELSQLPEAKMVAEKDILTQLNREPGCAARIACAAAAASRAGARQLILGTASELGDSFMVDLKLIDARSAQELRRATHPVSGSQDALIETLREAAVQLLAPLRWVGSLRVVVDAPGALIFVDGKQVGIAPLTQPVTGLAPGQHTLRVVDKSRELSTFVEVRFGQEIEARIELGAARVVRAALPSATASVQPVRAHPSWVRPAAIGAITLGVMSAAVAVGFNVRAYATASDLNQRESLNQLQPGDLPAYADVDHDTHMARGFYISGAILAAAGGALLWWDLH